jgi:hypothetical protein
VILTTYFIDGSRLSTVIFVEDEPQPLISSQSPEKEGQFDVAVDSVETVGGLGAIDFKPLIINLVFFVIIFIVAILALATSYVYAINSESLKTYMDTALHLAGFSSQMPKVGKTWTINQGVLLSLHKNIITF